MISVNDMTICKCCNKIFDDAVVLTCCNENICKNHITEENNKYICFFCQHQHDFATLNFPINKTLQQLIKKNFHKLDFGESFKQTKSLLDELSSIKKKFQIAIEDPNNFMHDYISDIKNKVDLRREELKVEIDRISDQAIKELDQFEKDCLTKAELNRISEKCRNGLNSYQKDLDLEQCYEDLSNFIIDNEKWDDYKCKAAIQINNVQNEFNDFKNSLLLNKTVLFDYDQNDIEFIEKELNNKLEIKERNEMVLRMDIKHFSQIVNQRFCIFSDYLFYKEFMFYMSCIRNEDDDNANLGLYLHCKTEQENNYPISVSFLTKLINFKDANKDEVKNIEYKYEEHTGYGVGDLISIEDVMNEENGFYDAVNDKISVEIEIVEYDSNSD